MRKLSPIKLLIVFAVAISLASLPGGLSRGFNLPTISLAHASVPTTAPCDVTGLGPGASSCSQFWYPAGPAMNSLANIIYTNEIAEYGTGMLGGQLDFTDWPVPSSQSSSFGGSNFFVTAPEYDHGYFELQINMANHLWGVDQNFGNSAAGIQVRQGLAHLVNRVTLVNTQGALVGQASAIDNPLPPGDGLVLPSTCGYDSNFPEAGAGCAAGAGHGGSEYNCGFASPACPTGTLGASPPLAWGAQIGSADFCAAAQHFVNAGIAASAPAAGGCVLSGISASASQPISATANSLCTSALLPQSAVCFYFRADNGGRQAYGQALASEICALFTGSYATSASTPPWSCAPFLTSRFGGIGNAICTIFSTTNCAATNPAGTGDPLDEEWGMYTGGFGSVFPQDAPYFLYHSQFVDKPNVATPCSSTTEFTFPGNYFYNCVNTAGSNEDKALFCMETAPSFDIANATAATGLPAPCNTEAITGGGTGAWGLQAQEIHGNHAVTIPIWAGLDQMVASNSPTGWSRFVTDQGNGLANFNTWLNAYSATPFQSGTIRQGFKTSPDTVNPYQASTVWDFYLLGNMYDSLSFQNPLNHNQLIDWLTSSSQKLAAVPSYAPTGTAVTYRFNLRNGVFFQNGQKLTSWDVVYSLKSFWDYGAFQSGGLFPINAITVLSPFTFDMHLQYDGPFLKFGLTGNTILPAALWSANAADFASTGPVGSCISSATQTGCLDATYAIDPISTTTPQCTSGSSGGVSCLVPATDMEVNTLSGFDTADPLTNGKFIGTGPWACEGVIGAISTLGGGCASPSGIISGATSITLTRYDQAVAGTAHEYFRSSNSLARLIWTADIGTSQDSLTQSTVASCVGKAVGTAGCTHWQNGIGSNTPGTPTVVAAGYWSEVTSSTAIPWLPVVLSNGGGYTWGELNTGGTLGLLGIGTAPTGYSPSGGTYTPTGGPTLYGASQPFPCSASGHASDGYDC